MNRKSIGIVNTLIIGTVLTSCSFALNNDRNIEKSINTSETPYSVSKIYELESSLTSGDYSEEEYYVEGYVLDNPTLKNSLNQTSFTIVDDLTNVNQKLTVLCAESNQDINQGDKVVVKSYVNCLNTTNLMLANKKENYSYKSCEISSIISNNVVSIAETEIITMLDYANYLNDKKEHYPLSDEFIEKYQQKDGGYIELAKSLNMNVDRQKHLPNQKWHFYDSWINLSFEAGTMTWEDDARRRIYTGLLCPELLLWIYEASGVNPIKVKKAMTIAENARSTGQNLTSMAKLMREQVLWDDLIAGMQEKIPATSVFLSKESIDITVNEEDQKLIATVLPNNCNETPSWSVIEGSECISIIPNGNEVTIHAEKEGKAKIRVTYNESVYADCEVNVIENNVIINLPSTIDLNLIDSFTLTPSLSKEEGTFTYSSSNNDVVFVDNVGKISSVNYGSAEITVTSVEYPELKKIVNVEVFNHGNQDNPLSIAEVNEITSKICKEDQNFSNRELYVQGKAKDNASNRGSFTLGDITSNVEIKVFDSINNLEKVSQNDEITIKGFILNNNNKLGLSSSEVLNNKRGESTISLGEHDNSVVKVNEIKFKETKLTNGETFTFTVEINDGFALESVKVNEITLIEENNVYSFEVNGNSIIKVFAYDTTSPYTSLAKYNIVTDGGTKMMNSTDTLFSTLVLDGQENNIITSVTEIDRMYGAATGGSGDTYWKIGNVLKIGTTSYNGSMTLAFSREISYVTITGYVYKNTAKIRIGDSSSTDWEGTTFDNKTKLITLSNMTIASKDIVNQNQPSSIVIEFTSTSSLKIATTNKSPLIITSIEFGIYSGK